MKKEAKKGVSEEIREYWLHQAFLEKSWNKVYEKLPAHLKEKMLSEASHDRDIMIRLSKKWRERRDKGEYYVY